jgi:hypothetical protein
MVVERTDTERSMHDGTARDAAQGTVCGWRELILLAGSLLVGTLMGEFARSGGELMPFLRQNLLMGAMMLMIAERAWRAPPRLPWSTLGGAALIVALLGFSWIYSISA